jgi:hypothetical protein
MSSANKLAFFIGCLFVRFIRELQRSRNRNNKSYEHGCWTPLPYWNSVPESENVYVPQVAAAAWTRPSLSCLWHKHSTKHVNRHKRPETERVSETSVSTCKPTRRHDSEARHQHLYCQQKYLTVLEETSHPPKLLPSQRYANDFNVIKSRVWFRDQFGTEGFPCRTLPCPNSNYELKVTVYRVVEPCGLVEVYRRFRDSCCMCHDMAKMTETACTRKTSVNFFQTLLLLLLLLFIKMYCKSACDIGGCCSWLVSRTAPCYVVPVQSGAW